MFHWVAMSSELSTLGVISKCEAPDPTPRGGRFRVRSISSGLVPENCRSGYTDPAYGGRGPLLRVSIGIGVASN
jgi:hypothetical protein